MRRKCRLFSPKDKADSPATEPGQPPSWHYSEPWRPPLHSGQLKNLSDSNLEWPVVQRLAKVDLRPPSLANRQVFPFLCSTSAGSCNSHTHTELPQGPASIKGQTGRHLPRGLRAAATLSPTFLRKFTLGSSDGPEALIFKILKQHVYFKIHFSMTWIPTAVLSPVS